MLACDDNISNVSRAFGCHRNTIIRLRQTGGVVDRRRSRVTNPRMLFSNGDKFCKEYGISKQTVLRSLRQAQQPIQPRRPYVGQVLTARHRAARFQWAQWHFHWGQQQGLGFYFLMRLGLILVIMMVAFEFLEEEGNVLLIIVSLRGTNLEMGVLWYGVALWAEGKQISLLCKATSMLKVSFKGMGLQY